MVWFVCDVTEFLERRSFAMVTKTKNLRSTDRRAMTTTMANVDGGDDYRHIKGRCLFLCLGGIDLILVCFLASSLPCFVVETERDNTTEKKERTTTNGDLRPSLMLGRAQFDSVG